MNLIEKIYVTGDFLRTNDSGTFTQNINTKWLYNLIRPYLELLTPLKIAPIYCVENSYCIGHKIFKLNNMQPTIDNWVKLYNKIPTAHELAILFDKFDGALVIAFELNEFTRQGFDILGIQYIDFTIHPARFLDDLIFGVRSNLLGIEQALQTRIVYEEEIHVAAGLAMASLSRLPKISTCTNGLNIALFTGQTTDDKVLIHNNKFMQVEQFMEDLAILSAKYDKILVKPHPYAKTNLIILALTRLFPNTELVETNFYHLLAQDEISHVYSLTSSTSIEAAYFGKKGIHLAPYPYVFSEFNAMNGHFLQIRPDLYHPNFWHSILELVNVPLNKIRSAIQIYPERNRMRRSLRSFWGADIFEK